MSSIVVTTEDRLQEIVEHAVEKFFKVETKKEEPDIISGTRDAVRYLSGNGYEVSESLFTKGTAKGKIPCRRFHNKRLVFSKRELLNWAENQCKPVGQTAASMTLAADANRKLRRR